MKKHLNVFIADDHTLFRKAMVNLLRGFSNIKDVKDAENGKELLTLMKYQVPDVAIVDLQMPVMDGTETSENILQKYPDVKIIILTMHDSEKFILHMMEMGVHAFLLKNTEPEELEEAIDAVMEKDFYHNNALAVPARKQVEECVTKNVETPALVFIRSFWLGHPFPIFLNPSDLKGPIIFACDRGVEDRKLMELYPERNIYILSVTPTSRSSVQSELIPIYRGINKTWLMEPEEINAPFFIGSKFSPPLKLQGEEFRKLFQPLPEEIVPQ